MFVQSEQMRLDVAAQGIPLHKMTAVPMGIRVDLCAPGTSSQRRRVLPAGVPCVLYLGTLNRVRRLDFLIRVFAAGPGRRAGSPVVHRGAGRSSAGSGVLGRRGGASRSLQSAVVFVGQLPQAQALAYVQEADVCTSPFYPTPVLQSDLPDEAG